MEQPTSVALLVSLDIAAAFDVVDHGILIQRLEEEFGITDTYRNWIMSYLTGCSATVRVGSSSSSTAGVPHGVPQGSILGPLLYTVFYVAPIGRLIHNLGVTYHQYANDTHVYTRLEVPATSSLASLQQCVAALHAWFSQSALSLLFRWHFTEFMPQKHKTSRKTTFDTAAVTTDVIK